MGFDAFHVWLGIPPEEQPPDHYRLLGIPRFESDPDVITNAADRQRAHVRTFQAGPRGEASQILLNKLAAAKICLLTPEKKVQYDRAVQWLLDHGGGRTGLASGVMRAIDEDPAPVTDSPAAPPVRRDPPPARRPAGQVAGRDGLWRNRLGTKRPRLLQWDWLAVYASLVLLAGMIGWIKVRYASPPPDRPPRSPARKAAPKTLVAGPRGRQVERAAVKPQDTGTPQKPRPSAPARDRKDTEALLGRWDVRIEKMDYRQTWTFFAGGKVATTAPAIREGRWSLKPERIHITWRRGGKTIPGKWATFQRPLDTRGVSGDTHHGEDVLRATKIGR